MRWPSHRPGQYPLDPAATPPAALQLVLALHSVPTGHHTSSRVITRHHTSMQIVAIVLQGLERIRFSCSRVCPHTRCFRSNGIKSYGIKHGVWGGGAWCVVRGALLCARICCAAFVVLHAILVLHLFRPGRSTLAVKMYAWMGSVGAWLRIIAVSRTRKRLPQPVF